jgi:ribonuclease P protein component
MDVRATASLPAFPRVGFVVPKYKQSAVARNRLKRRLREIVRLHVLPDMPPLDLVIRVFPSAYDRSPDALRQDLEQALRRLSRDVGRDVLGDVLGNVVPAVG